MAKAKPSDACAPLPQTVCDAPRRLVSIWSLPAVARGPRIWLTDDGPAQDRARHVTTMHLEEIMTKLQTGRRAIWAVAAALAAVAPLRGARAQSREDQARTGDRRQASLPGSAGGTSPFIWARNEKEFRQALAGRRSRKAFVPMFDPRTAIEQSSTIVLEQRKNEGMTWGANGNHAKIRWVGPGGQDMIVVQGVNGVANRGFYLREVQPVRRRLRSGTVRCLPEAPRAAGRRRGALQIHVARHLHQLRHLRHLPAGRRVRRHVRERAWREPHQGWHVHGAYERRAAPTRGSSPTSN